MYDTGIRAPTELLNIKVSDIQKHPKHEYYELNIRDETSKTFGRKIKLLLCLDMVNKYIKDSHLDKNDYLFDIKPATINKYFKRMGQKLFDIKDLTMYDFRHSSACYWLPRYPTESGMKYRFGWKRTDMIHYYTEFLGMKDTITQEDLIDGDEKTLIQKELAEIKKQYQIREEEYKAERREHDKTVALLMQKYDEVQKFIVAEKFKKKMVKDVASGR